MNGAHGLTWPAGGAGKSMLYVQILARLLREGKGGAWAS